MKEQRDTMRLDQIKGNVHVKRALEVAAVIHAPVTLLSRSNMLDALAFAAWESSTMPITIVTPCPCGNFLSDTYACTCTPDAIREHQHQHARYYMEDNLYIEVTLPKYEDFTNRSQETDERIGERITQARVFFHQVSSDMDTASQQLMKTAIQQFGGLSSIGYTCIITRAKAIAALAESSQIRVAHLAESLQYVPRIHTP